MGLKSFSGDPNMKNLSIRTALLAILAAFAVMIVGGGVAGIVALDAANASTERVHTISARCILLNDAYKDMTRARAALTRAYSTVRENPASGGRPVADLRGLAALRRPG
jgi:methyl-accepting chemotaxis protein